jgi:excisionase family DNA binding protein
METPTLAPALLTVPEGARFLALGRSKLYELIAAGELPVVRIGRAVRLPRAGLEAWVARQAEDATLGGGTRREASR